MSPVRVCSLFWDWNERQRLATRRYFVLRINIGKNIIVNRVQGLREWKTKLINKNRLLDDRLATGFGAWSHAPPLHPQAARSVSSRCYQGGPWCLVRMGLRPFGYVSFPHLTLYSQIAYSTYHRVLIVNLILNWCIHVKMGCPYVQHILQGKYMYRKSVQCGSP